MTPCRERNRIAWRFRPFCAFLSAGTLTRVCASSISRLAPASTFAGRILALRGNGAQQGASRWHVAFSSPSFFWRPSSSSFAWPWWRASSTRSSPAPASRRRATITPSCALSCAACRRAATSTPICPAPSMPNGSSRGRHSSISARTLRTRPAVEAAVRPSGRRVRGRRHARSEALRSTGQRVLDALLRADRRGAERSRQILRRVRQIRRRVRLAFRRHDDRPAQAVSQRERAVRRVHGVVCLLERSRPVHQGDGRADRRCRQARGAASERSR